MADTRVLVVIRKVRPKLRRGLPTFTLGCKVGVDADEVRGVLISVLIDDHRVPPVATVTGGRFGAGC